MSRRWTASTPSVMRYTLPTTPATGPVNFNWGTILFACRFVTSPSWASFIEFDNSSGVFSHGLGRSSDGALAWSDSSAARKSNAAGTGTSFTIGTGDDFCLFYFKKAAGTVSPQLGKIPLTSQVHTLRLLTETSINVPSLSAGRINLGGDEDAADIEGVMAAVIPGIVLSDAAIVAIAAGLATSGAVSVAGTDGWVVDDSDAFATNLVAANTPRTTDTGTSDDADDPAGWVYGVGGSPTTSLRVRRRRRFAAAPGLISR